MFLPKSRSLISQENWIYGDDSNDNLHQLGKIRDTEDVSQSHCTNFKYFIHNGRQEVDEHEEWGHQRYGFGVDSSTVKRKSQQSVEYQPQKLQL